MSLGLKLHYFAAVTSGLTLFAGLTPWSKYELAQRIDVLAHPLVERHITPFSRQMRWPQKSTRHWRRTAPKPFHVLLGRESGLQDHQGWLWLETQESERPQKPFPVTSLRQSSPRCARIGRNFNNMPDKFQLTAHSPLDN